MNRYCGPYAKERDAGAFFRREDYLAYENRHWADAPI